MRKPLVVISYLLLLPTCQTPPADSQAGGSDIVIRGGTVVTMDPGRRILDGGAVVIRGETIEAVLEAREPIPPARETVDATGHLVIPGLVNTHGHIAMSLLRGIADETQLPLADVNLKPGLNG